MNNNQDTAKNQDKATSAVLKLLAVFGLIAILALAAWVSIQVIRFAPTAFNSLSGALSYSTGSVGSLFGGDRDIEFDLSTSTLAADEPFEVAWKHRDTTGTSSFELEYECADGFSILVVDGDKQTETSCEEPHEFVTDGSTLSIIPVSENNRFLDVTLTLRALAENAAGDTEISDDSVQLTVINSDIADSRSAELAKEKEAKEEKVAEEEKEKTVEKTEEAETPTQTASVGTVTVPAEPKTVYVPNPRTRENPNGSPDLALTILNSGIALEVDGKDSFYPASPIPTDQRAAIVFVVENMGDKTSDRWDFVATLPIEGDEEFEFESGTQEPLAPGSKITFTLKFDEVLEEEQGKIFVTMDPGANDSNEANDTDLILIDIREV